jgi:hypothetical protein
MKGYRFITDDDTSKLCHHVSEILSRGWKLYGEPQMTFDKKGDVMRCGQAVKKDFSKKVFQKNQTIFNIINDKGEFYFVSSLYRKLFVKVIFG